MDQQIDVGELEWIPVLSLLYSQFLAYRTRACQRKGCQVEREGLRLPMVRLIQAATSAPVQAAGWEVANSHLQTLKRRP